MEGFPPSYIEEDVNMMSNELDFQSLLPDLEPLSPPPEVPVNQSSILCNDQGGQNNVINDRIQQTTPFPTSFPETMLPAFYVSASASFFSVCFLMSSVLRLLSRNEDNSKANSCPCVAEAFSGFCLSPCSRFCSPVYAGFFLCYLLSPGRRMACVSIGNEDSKPFIAGAVMAGAPVSLVCVLFVSGVLGLQIRRGQIRWKVNTPSYTSMRGPSLNFVVFRSKIPPGNRATNLPCFANREVSSRKRGQGNQEFPMMISVKWRVFLQIPPMEGFQPSSMDDDLFDLQSPLLSYVILKHILSEDDCLQFSYSSVYPIIPKKQYNVVTVHGGRPAPEVPVNQGSISCNDQGGQNNAINDIIQQTTQFPTSFPETMTGHRYMTQNATTSQHVEFNQPGPSSPAPCEFIMFEYRYQPNLNLFDPQCANPMVPGPSMPLRDQRWTNYQLPIMSNQVPAMLPGPQPPLNQWHQNSFIHQPQKGHGYMTPNATTSQHGGFNQPGPSFPAPWIQHFPNQGQVDKAFAIPNIDNMQQENFVPRNFGNSTRSQMDNLQVRGLQNQTARPNASNPGLGTSLQSQNRGLNTQQVEMGGSNDSFRNYVEERADGSMKCKFCPHTYATKTSISRIKWHLSREEGHGVSICRGVAKEVQEAAWKAMCRGNKRLKSTESSINVNDSGISTCPQEQNNEIENLGGGIGRVQREVQVGNLAGAAGRIQVGVQGVLEQGAGEERINRVRVRTEPVEEDVENSLKYNKTRGLLLPLSSTKPVGQAFEENTKVIWSLLMDGDVSTIGIYGMGGVGKSTILEHIHNELLQRPDICDNVWWVTVSQDFSINRLQNLIAEHLDLDLSRKNDELHRAAKLSEELRKKQKWIFILDDLWNNFELHKVGIPEKLEGCKLIMTTRSETVCHRMACQHKIKVKPLSNGEAWTLFMEKLHRDVALSPEVEGIAKAVARECAGLPLGIIAVAGSLRGVDDPHEWRNTLNKLRESEFRDIDDKVFRLLRFSYDRLGDLALKQCLLYCALFPEDNKIEREELIGYLIDEGIIKGKRSRGDAFDEGNTMLNRLEYVCLLESAQMRYDDIRRVKMHDLIRDMAIHILQDEYQVMVKAGAQLKELPDAEQWTENLTMVSLMRNEIEEIPSSYSPRCPYLSTLFLCDNKGLRFVADSFFKQLHGLKVLDLSWTGIENLPDSVSDLVSLTALLLKQCENLHHVPSLKKLRALKRLDLSRTRLEKMPQGMECLTSLRYLRMNGCGGKEFPSGILPKLSQLQVFVLEECMMQDDAPITVKGKEIVSLRNLETLECHFEGFSDFVEYLRSRDGILSLSTHKILVGEVGRYGEQLMEDFPSKTVGLGNLSINGDRDFQVKFLNGLQGLYCDLIDARSLCDVLSLENATELERITIMRCDNMESLVSSSWFCSAPPRLPPYNGMFSGLKKFYCYGCNNMKKLFPLVLLPNLVNLERIDVSFCYKMEEIIGITDEESSSSNSIMEVILPKLRILKLFDLPELKSICSAKLICNSLKVIHVAHCEKLKRMPICLPLLENGQPSPPPSLAKILAIPKEWWESVVEWKHPNTKDVIRPFVN
ncbi:disease resistance protein [Populus alba x Populus x berolinensis]|nr:disease resistance protein [Populus alba x Populus x berolinensis]